MTYEELAELKEAVELDKIKLRAQNRAYAYYALRDSLQLMKKRDSNSHKNMYLRLVESGTYGPLVISGESIYLK